MIATAVSLLLLTSLGAHTARPDGDTAWWSSWRGPLGCGVAPAGQPPTHWSEEKNIRWKAAIPGLGSSSPIIWGERIYLTSAIAGPREEGGSSSEKVPHDFVVLAIERATGRIAWRTKVKTATPHERGHRTGSNASNSPITDGEHIYAHFGSRGIYCLDMKGEIVWSRDLGRMHTRREFGEGSSPALHGDTLVINWDHEGPSFITALDKRSGEELWRRPRDELTNWTTPLIVTADERPQVIVPGTNASRSYDLETGEVLWTCTGMTQNCIPSPFASNGVVYLMSGFRGNAFQAIRLAGAKGDLSAGDHLLWSHGRGTSYVPSALLYQDYLYFVRSNSPVLTCLDARTGKVHYEGRRLREMRTIYSSPVGAGERVYITSREGTTKVLALGPQYRELATNHLDDSFDASAAIAGDSLFLRGHKALYCIAATTPPGESRRSP